MASCESCATTTDDAALPASLWCCPSCGFHLPMPARARLALVCDEASIGGEVDTTTGGDPLGFIDLRTYPDRLAEARADTGEGESVVVVRATVGGVPCVVGAFDFRFMGGTLSPAAGERLTRGFEVATDERRAVLLCTSSGGARMQEGTLSLFQMARVASAIASFREVRRPYVALLGHPTLGGVAASFATRADVILAEPRARIGFAGPRVIEQILGHRLPPGFQRAEFQLAHGRIDRIVARKDLRAELAALLPLLAGA